MPQLLFEDLKLLLRDAGRFCDQRPLHTCRQEAVDRLDLSLDLSFLSPLLPEFFCVGQHLFSNVYGILLHILNKSLYQPPFLGRDQVDDKKLHVIRPASLRHLCQQLCCILQGSAGRFLKSGHHPQLGYPRFQPPLRLLYRQIGLVDQKMGKAQQEIVALVALVKEIGKFGRMVPAALSLIEDDREDGTQLPLGRMLLERFVSDAAHVLEQAKAHHTHCTTKKLFWEYTAGGEQKSGHGHFLANFL